MGRDWYSSLFSLLFSSVLSSPSLPFPLSSSPLPSHVNRSYRGNVAPKIHFETSTRCSALVRIKLLHCTWISSFFFFFFSSFSSFSFLLLLLFAFLLSFIDDSGSGFEISSNSFVNCSTGIMVGGGRDNHMEDSILIPPPPPLPLPLPLLTLLLLPFFIFFSSSSSSFIIHFSSFSDTSYISSWEPLLLWG